MDRTLTIPDALYQWLEDTMRRRGLTSVQQLLEQLRSGDSDIRSRQEAVQRIDALRARLCARYGELTDSVALIRDDRAR